ncbi:MAG: ABC transporter permease [Sphaerochaeta sp.]|jgi:simple sugar transport system permease protein|nr:ABC transporter permease [Sphaerochaeta sp.]MCH3918979.1 ABC transporter permease [Sphaerochaeta sp.]MCI2045368.1 ABC transporter permease [Sphaerochaeta sp.]MCI2075751.1 ABC transporter permease [Sphaerochaeta sp.]MCI2097112.1 ABC transporter permease [Sphaerochaeta sp.]
MNVIVTVLSLAITSSVALLLASLGEMINQRAGIFNLGCEGIMSMGAFLGMLLPYAIGHGQATSQVYNVLGLLSATVMGALLGMFFGLVVITFRAPQGIAGIGLQMFGTGAAGTLFRHFVGGTQSIPGITTPPIPLLSRIPVIGPIFFSQNILVYVAFLLVPLSGYVLFKTPWGLAVRAVGTHPRAADSIGINVTRIRYQSLAVGGALAGLAGAYLSLCQAKMFSDSIVSGRGFIAVALVYFGHWQPVKIMWGALLFSLAQTFQTVIQSYGINFPYEFAVMLPYVLVIVVLAFDRESQRLGPTSLGIPFNREIRT